MTGCFSYFAATLTPYVRVSASFEYHEDYFQISSYVFNQEWSFWWSGKKFQLTGNSLDFFFYFKQRVHVILREITMRKLSCGKDLQSRASQLGSDTCKCESYRNVRVLNLLACHFLVNIIIIIIYELIVRSLTWEWSAAHYNCITLKETNKR